MEVVTEEPRLILEWRGKDIVNISRAFLDTNGAHQEADVEVEMPKEEDNFFKKIELPKVADALQKNDNKSAWLAMLADLNVCSQMGLVEMFDGSIGAGSVYMPYGGRYQLTETQSMVAKLPVLKGKCDTVTMMSYGFYPYLSSWSPYHGSVYAVLESLSRIVTVTLQGLDIAVFVIGGYILTETVGVRIDAGCFAVGRVHQAA